MRARTWVIAAALLSACRPAAEQAAAPSPSSSSPQPSGVEPSSAPSSTRPLSTLGFAGIALTTDPRLFMDRFPKSSHDLTIDQKRVDPTPERLAAGNWDTYTIRLDESEVFRRITYLSFWNEGREVQISFEKAESAVRYPLCSEVRAEIVSKHGEPSKTHRDHEEQMETLAYTWTDTVSTMTLRCGALAPDPQRAYGVELSPKP